MVSMVVRGCHPLNDFGGGSDRLLSTWFCCSADASTRAWSDLVASLFFGSGTTFALAFLWLDMNMESIWDSLSFSDLVISCLVGGWL